MEIFHDGHSCKQGKEILPKTTNNKETLFIKKNYRAECLNTQQTGQEGTSNHRNIQAGKEL